MDAETPDAAQRSARLLSEAALIIDGWSRVRERLRALHTRGADGRCVACHSPTRPGPVWPCTLAVVAGTSPQP